MMVLTFQVGRLLRTAPQFGGRLLRFAHKKTGTLRENAQMQAPQCPVLVRYRTTREIQRFRQNADRRFG